MNLRLPINLVTLLLVALPTPARSSGAETAATDIKTVIAAMIDAARTGVENDVLSVALYGLGCNIESIGKPYDLDELLSQRESFEFSALLGKMLSLYPGMCEEMISRGPAFERKLALVALSAHPVRFVIRAQEMIAKGDPGVVAVVAAAAGCARYRLGRMPTSMRSIKLRNHLADIARKAENVLERKISKDQCGRNSPVLAGLLEDRIVPDGRGSINGVQWIYAVGDDGIRYMFSPACACSLYKAAAARRRYFPELLLWLLDAGEVSAKDGKTAMRLLARDLRHFKGHAHQVAAVVLAARKGEMPEISSLLRNEPEKTGQIADRFSLPSLCVECPYLWVLSFARNILPDSLSAVTELDCLQEAVANLDAPGKSEQAAQTIQNAGRAGLDLLIRTARAGEQNEVLSRALQGAGCKGGFIGPVVFHGRVSLWNLPYKAGFQIGRMLAHDAELRKDLLNSGDEFEKKLAWVGLVADPRLFCEQVPKALEKHGARDAGVIQGVLTCIRRRSDPKDVNRKRELDKVQGALSSTTFKVISEEDCRLPDRISGRFLPGLLDGSIRPSGWDGDEKHFSIRLTTRDNVNILLAVKCVLIIYKAAARQGRYFPDLIFPIIENYVNDNGRLVKSLRVLLRNYPKLRRRERDKVIKLLVELARKDLDNTPPCPGCLTPAVRKAIIKDARTSLHGLLEKLFDKWNKFVKLP